MGHTQNADGSLVINPTPQTVEDLQAIADLAAGKSAMPPGTRAERLLLTSAQVRAGWLFVETDTGDMYKRSASGWDLVWSDSDWIPLTRATGMTALDGVSSAYRIMGSVVWIRVAATGTFPAGLRNVANGLPVEARPSPSTGIVRAAAAGGPGGAAVVATVYPAGHPEAGNVAIANLTGTDRTWAAGVFSYPQG